MPLVVSGGFMPPSIVAVILSFPGLAEQLGGVGGLAIAPGGPFVPGGDALMPAPLRALLVAFAVVGHTREATSHCVGRRQAQVVVGPLSGALREGQERPPA